MLRVGDRVAGADYSGRFTGTVVAVPSTFGSGYVDVARDDGCEGRGTDGSWVCGNLTIRKITDEARDAIRNTDEVRVVDPETGGAKGQKLAQLGGLDPAALLELAKVAGAGAKKYDRFNYAKGYAWSLSYDALFRHLLAFLNGEDDDPEDGLPHMAHAAWHCLTLLTFSLRKLGTDDRFPR